MLLKITRGPGDPDLSEENDMNTHWHTYIELQKSEEYRSNAVSMFVILPKLNITIHTKEATISKGLV